MKTSNKYKFLLGFSYILILSVFLYFIFSNFSFQEIGNYNFIKDNREFFVKLKEKNVLILATIFIFFTIIWVLLLGFGSPICIVGGFIFGTWLGTILVAISLTIGATSLYVFCNLFFKDLVKNNFLNKFKYLEDKFKKNEFIFFLIYRFIGGIPFAIQNLLPVIFNVRLRNYFYGTLIGLFPQVFVIVSLGSGFDKLIEENETVPEIKDILFSPNIYIPIISITLILLIAFFIRKKFIK
ncbi:VTT domain-containing protein [Candidatus Pelagibacter sp.]|nr:VTT domain-containing protein [Candidatus Pelagibacter sp.]